MCRHGGQDFYGISGDMRCYETGQTSVDKVVRSQGFSEVPSDMRCCEARQWIVDKCVCVFSSCFPQVVSPYIVLACLYSVIDMADAQVPAQVSLVVLGDRTPEGRVFLDLLHGQSDVDYMEFDVREWLTELVAGHSPRYQQDGTHKNTQMCVMAQERFNECVRTITDWIVERSRIDDHVVTFPGGKCTVGLRRVVIIKCSHGMHRSSTVAHAVRECLNAQYNDNLRVFNCRVSTTTGRAICDQHEILKQADLWRLGPWTVSPAVMMCDKQSIYGHDACTESPAAWYNWLRFYQFLCTGNGVSIGEEYNIYIYIYSHSIITLITHQHDHHHQHRHQQNDVYDNGGGGSDDCNDGGSIGEMAMTLMMIM